MGSESGTASDSKWFPKPSRQSQHNDLIDGNAASSLGAAGVAYSLWYLRVVGSKFLSELMVDVVV